MSVETSQQFGFQAEESSSNQLRSALVGALIEVSDTYKPSLRLPIADQINTCIGPLLTEATPLLHAKIPAHYGDFGYGKIRSNRDLLLEYSMIDVNLKTYYTRAINAVLRGGLQTVGELQNISYFGLRGRFVTSMYLNEDGLNFIKTTLKPGA